MVVPTSIINTIKNDVLSQFDSYTHIAVGSDATAESPSDTALGTETLREVFIDSDKNTTTYKYLWSIQLGLTEANGTTLNEVGIFDASSGGNMGLRKVLPSAFAKTSDKEVWIDVELSVSVTQA